MKYRDHRGGLRASMETVREIAPKIDALAIILKVPPSAIIVEKYGDGIDERIGWDTHLVCVEGLPVGFTDAMPT
jgi:hypothetical protein